MLATIILIIKIILCLMIIISKMKKKAYTKMLNSKFVINVKYIANNLPSFLNKFKIMKIFKKSKK